LNYVGRFVCAIECWNRSISHDHNFGMALANKGYGLFHYAQCLYDQGHMALFLKKSHDYLEEGLSKGVDMQAVDTFRPIAAWIAEHLPAEHLDRPFEKESFSLGKTKGEQRYRQWCLDQRLFLNPLNDLGAHSIAAQDVFSVPSIVVSIGEGPRYQGLFNQMKQEYVSARYLLYEGLSAERPHFADRDVLLLDTLDYPCYSVAIERQKLAMRSAYSIFDKVAFFLNHYLNLGISDRRISFRSLWYVKQTKNNGLRSEFSSLQNWPLRGLFWLAKDLFEDAPGFRASLEPGAAGLADIRNHLEHKYLKVHDDMWHGPEDDDDDFRKCIIDDLACSITREQLGAACVLLFQLVRAALIYLSLGIHVEERRRAEDRPADARIGVSPLMSWPDEWKI